MGCVCSKNQEKKPTETDNIGLVSKKTPSTEPVANPVQSKGSPVEKGALQRSSSSLKNAAYAPLSPDTPGTALQIPPPPGSPGSPRARTPEPKKVHYANVVTSEDDFVEVDEGTCNILLAPSEPHPSTPPLAEEATDSLPADSLDATTPRAPDLPGESVGNATPMEEDYSDDDGGPVVTGEFAEDDDYEQIMSPDSIAQTDYTEDDGVIVSRREVSISKLQVEVDSDDEVEEDSLAPRFSFTQRT